ncbi:MAG: hypothetical protein BWK73_28115 [Thiothrix lacustris]|uniref:Phosphatidic acid phosphatase type 2/haloperoxidase domain-containing protein n=1 Tax=Thiothrix lacustris TaxID=525917 RepID=A0A1Y1QKB4_9GAMM|nr:MAG: hypothetical protein BWK73_28115 [Thiothrix lacustris]
MQAYFQPLLDLATQHPLLAIALAFAISAGEAMLVIGLFVPSTIVLVSLGGLVGLGKLPFWPIFLAATAGAVVGDALSYWVGYKYREHLYAIWPFSRYASLLDNGQAYFLVHGGKSVVIGRFIPGVKSVVPSVAGMMGMKPLRFTVLNVLSAFTWAAAHLLPGLSAGVVMLGLGAISQRLAMMLGMLLMATALLVWAGKHGISLGLHYVPRWQAGLRRWGNAHDSRLAGWMRWVTAAERAEMRLLVALNLLLVLGLVSFFLLLFSVTDHGVMVQFDHAFSQSVQVLRTVWTDALMLVATLLGDAVVVVAIVMAVLLVLAAGRRWYLLSGVAVVLGAALLFVILMKGLMQVLRPVIGLYSGADAYAFPSGHATMSLTLLGLLAWFVVRGYARWGRVMLASLLGLMAVLVAFSRIYLGAHWPSDVLAGWLFGIGLLAVFAEVFRQESVSRQLAARMLVAAMLALVVVGGWHILHSWEAATALYARRLPEPVVLAQPWAAGGWADLPVCRMDVGGECEEPFVLQWRGTPAGLQQALLGWAAAVPWSVQALNTFAFPASSAQQLPVLPKFDRGQTQAFTWVKGVQRGDVVGRYVLRLYPQQVQEATQPLFTVWQGTLVFERLVHPLGQLSLPLSLDGEVKCASTPLLSGLPHAQEVGALRDTPESHVCGGKLVLASE